MIDDGNPVRLHHLKKIVFNGTLRTMTEIFSLIAAPITSDWDVKRIGTIIDELIYQLEAGSLIINSSFRNICTATIRPVYLLPYFCAYAVPDSIHLSVRVQGSQKRIKNQDTI